MSSLPLSLVSEGHSSTRMNNSGLLEDESVTLKTGNVTTRVREGDLINLIRIKPDLVLSALTHGALSVVTR